MKAACGVLPNLPVAPTNQAMLYLLGVVLSSFKWGLGPALMSSVISTVVFDYLLAAGASSKLPLHPVMFPHAFSISGTAPPIVAGNSSRRAGFWIKRRSGDRHGAGRCSSATR